MVFILVDFRIEQLDSGIQKICIMRPPPLPPLTALLREIRACRFCAKHLPFPPRPVVRGQATATLLIVGQAPGRRVHETGIPWNDPSGDRLRQWLEMSRDEFYDERRIAILPAAFCYPGKGVRGDLPPRPECAPRWHPRLRQALPRIRLVLLVGSYAQAYYLHRRLKPSMAETVRNYRDYLPEFFPLPHPSPRNYNWLKTHPWFEKEVIPELRRRVRQALDAVDDVRHSSGEKRRQTFSASRPLHER
jgi:uracil-DNA glycosylase